MGGGESRGGAGGAALEPWKGWWSRGLWSSEVGAAAAAHRGRASKKTNAI
jgi:hypothetical protein